MQVKCPNCQHLFHPPPPKKKKASTPTLPDDEWLASLGKNPAYRHINITIEFHKMREWCNVNRKVPSRRRFINWINRSRQDAPMAVDSKPSISQPPRMLPTYQPNPDDRLTPEEVRENIKKLRETISKLANKSSF